MDLESVGFSTSKIVKTKNIELKENEKVTFKETLSIENEKYTSPYWLNEKATLGMYHVSNQLLIGKPETPRIIKVDFYLNILNRPIKIT